MSDFTFACPKCRQNLMCDTSYAGQQITCPLCNQTVVVPPPPAKQRSSGRMVKALIISAIVLIVLAAFGAGGWFFYKHQATKGNPETEVATPTAAAAMQALSILTKVHSAYTNAADIKAEGTLTLFLNLSNITTANVNPNTKADAKGANRHPMGMPRIITNSTQISVKRGQTNMYFLFTGDAVSKVDAQTFTTTFAFWKSDKGQFTFMDMHQKAMPPMYQQLPDMNPANNSMQQMQNVQHFFEDPANLTKIVKNLGQTEDESVNGQVCYTLTAKVFGQKVKVWVDKSTYLISQWQITLGGKLSDADIDDAVSAFSAIFTNVPPSQFEMAKTQIKKMAPITTKIRGVLTSTSQNIEINQTFTAADFNYPVPPGVRLVSLNGNRTAGSNRGGGSSENSKRNACINNLRQIDAAKTQWALENHKKDGTPVTESDIKIYIKLDANGNLPKCPDGGKYIIGKIGEKPTCSVNGHVLP